MPSPCKLIVHVEANTKVTGESRVPGVVTSENELALIRAIGGWRDATMPNPKGYYLDSLGAGAKSRCESTGWSMDKRKNLKQIAP